MHGLKNYKTTFLTTDVILMSYIILYGYKLLVRSFFRYFVTINSLMWNAFDFKVHTNHPITIKSKLGIFNEPIN